jgi:hypothetical protein
VVVTPRYLSQTFVAIYWIVLPLLGLVVVGGLVGAALARPLDPTLFIVPAVSGVLSVLIGWRLLKNRRALAATRPLSKSDLALFSDAPESERSQND